MAMMARCRCRRRAQIRSLETINGKQAADVLR